jgi:hypothetical protein
MTPLQSIEKALNRIMENHTKKYKKLLSKYEWGLDYEKADEHSIEKHSVVTAEILKLSGIVDPDFEIYNQYAPQMFKKESKNDN